MMGLRDAWRWVRLGQRISDALKRGKGMNKRTAWKATRNLLVGAGGVAVTAIGAFAVDPMAVQAALGDSGMTPGQTAAIVLVITSVAELIRGAFKHRNK